MTQLDRAREAQLRRGMQYVFQDPLASLDPRLTIGFSIAEPITHASAAARRGSRAARARIAAAGGAAARACAALSARNIRRAAAACLHRARARVRAELIVADEAVAALDVSIRAQVVNLLMELQARLGVAYLFISHDMAVVERVSHRVAVMYLGQIVEIGPRQAVFGDPQHPYTRRLLAAVPIPDPRRRDHSIELDDSEVPSPLRRLTIRPSSRRWYRWARTTSSPASSWRTLLNEEDIMLTRSFPADLLVSPRSLTFGAYRPGVLPRRTWWSACPTT